MKNKDILFRGIPAIWHNDSILLFSPYAGEIARFSSLDELRLNENSLKSAGFFGKPHTLRENPEAIRMVLILTNDCRLRCRYCFAQGGEKKEDMSIELAQAAIEAAWKEKKKTAKTMEILFFGGEPTTKMPTVKSIVAFTKKFPVKKYFHINTDGLLSHEDLSWLMENKFFIKVSFDGPPEAQNNLRPKINGEESSKHVIKTIRKLVSEKALFAIRATMTRFNHLPDLVGFCTDLGVRFVHFEVVSRAGRADQSMFPDLRVYTEEFAKALAIAEKKEIYIITSPLMNLFFPADHFCTQMIGKKYIFHPSGKILSCYFSEEYKTGEINSDNKDLTFNEQKNKLMKLPLPEDCTDCPFKYLCSGGCPAENKAATGSFDWADKDFCTINKEILRQSIISLYEGVESGRNFFPVTGPEILERKIKKEMGRR